MARFILLRKHYINGGIGIMAFALLGMLLVIAPLKVKQMQVASWVPAQALLLDVQLAEQHKGGGRYLYAVTASYNYSVDGLPIEGSGVGLQPKPDGDKSFHEALYQKLSQYNNGATAIEIRYNPSQPKESVIFSDIRWGPLWGALALWIFVGLAGAGVFLYGVSINKTDL